MPDRPHPRHALEAVTHPDPWPYYAALRRERPLHFDPALGLWVAASASAVEAALRHPQLRVRPPAEPVPRTLAGTPVGEVFARLVRMNDGEFHARQRPVVEQALRRWSLDDVASAATLAADALAADADGNAAMNALPVQALGRLLGIGPGGLDDAARWVPAFTQAIAPGADEAAIGRGNEAVRSLLACGEALGWDAQATIHRIAFMQQSLDATAGLVGQGVLALRSGVALPAAGAASWRAWTAEVARWTPPVHNTRRFAATEGELAGQALKAGDAVLVLLASANRDESLDRDPHVFDPRRIEPRSLGFGGASHRCPGEAIAIEIAATALRRWHDADRLHRLFGAAVGFRPLANARIPVFENAAKEQ